jgi:G2/mitotic-specific cyclin 3/4
MPPSKQSLHQRHKSTGTLSTFLGVGGGLKMAAKRTAFGDVSNTAKIVGTVHDDTINKNTSEFLPKPSQPQEKNMGFLRPAQRPLNVVGLKGFVSNSNANTSISAPKGSVVDLQQQSQFTKPRTLSKRATTIYKDQIVADSSLPSQRANAPASENRAPVPPTHQTIGPRQHKSQPQLKAGYPALQVSQNKYTAVSIENSQDDSDSTSPVDKGSAKHDINPVAAEACIVSTSHEESHDVVIQNGENNKRQDREPSPHPVSDPEEYWDEEEEEVYDEQGYATIHSYKSRSDNTTSGATTVLFPRITNRVKKELAIAKEIVESSRTVDEIEDEAWDTSMVAEYGDEIFQYMRELEVSFFLIIGLDILLRGFVLAVVTVIVPFRFVSFGLVSFGFASLVFSPCLRSSLISIINRIKLNVLNRSECCLTHTIWITKQKFNGRCAQYLWIG